MVHSKSGIIWLIIFLMHVWLQLKVALKTIVLRDLDLFLDFWKSNFFLSMYRISQNSGSKNPNGYRLIRSSLQNLSLV